MLRDEFDKVSLQKKQLQKKVAQFDSLQSYENYLNEFQEILKEKETDIIEREQKIQV